MRDAGQRRGRQSLREICSFLELSSKAFHCVCVSSWGHGEQPVLLLDFALTEDKIPSVNYLLPDMPSELFLLKGHLEVSFSWTRPYLWS